MQDAVADREARLLEESEARQALLDAMAHEMRTPLTSLLGNARLLQHDLPEDERVKIADSMAREIHRLTDMDQQLMKLTVLRHEEPEIEQVSVSGLLKDTAVRLQEQAKGITIKVQGADSMISGDPELLSLLCDNLTANALHVSEPGMTVTLTSVPGGFTVEDQGPGMNEEALKHAFEPFWKADKARTRRHGGAGLGLSLCMQIAELHRGKLSFDSAPGKGTRVTFTTALPAVDDSFTSPVT
jgi:signal transduction histidine kinase